MGLPEALAYLDQTADERVEELRQLLRIPSVSTDPDRRPAMAEAAQSVRASLERAGLQAEIAETGGHPIVYGERLDRPGAPTVLVYGHYDVQPADEQKDGWSSPPFEPRYDEATQNLHARGATDDKGQMYTWVKAAEAWHHAGGPPVNVKYLIEGEEEVGSTHLADWTRQNRERLAADIIAISDCDQYGPGQPAITYGLRGILYVEVRCYGQKTDVHSGMYGGAIMNPATALCRVLGRLHDEDGRIQVDGFYDDVRALEDWERMAFRDLGHDDEAYAARLGIPTVSGEAGYSTLERTWARPTLEVNGLFGGFMERGAKTVLPSYAGAKVSMRLVPDQDPDKVLEGLRKTIARLTPPGVRIEVTGPGPGATATGDERHHPVTDAPEGAPPVLLDRDSPFVRAAAAAFEQGFGTAPVYVRSGGSIPIVLTFKEILGLESVLMGYGLPDDGAHGPDEKMHLPDFHRGCRTSAIFLQEVASRIAPSGKA